MFPTAYPRVRSASWVFRVLLLVCLLFTGRPGNADDKAAVAPELPETQDEVVTAMLAGRQSIVSGQVSGTEVIENEGKDGSRQVKKARFELVFDFKAARFRFDYRNDGDRRTNFVCFESPESRVVFSEASGVKDIRRRDDKARRRRPEIFDPRLLGVATGAELRQGLFAERRDLLSEYFAEAKVSGPADSSKRVISVISHKGLVHTRYIVDVAKGHTPIQVTRHLIDAKSDDAPKPLDTTTAEWTRLDGVYVPSVVSMTIHTPGGSKSRRITLQWTSVNKPIPEELLDHENLKLPDGSTIVDAKTDPERPVIINRK